MTRSTLLIVVLALSATCPSAQTNHANWYVCSKDQQCAIIRTDCGVAWAANRHFASETKESRGAYSCTKPIETHPPSTVAKCEESRCVLVPRGRYAGGTEMPAFVGSPQKTDNKAR